ncbi:MAG: HlyD family secretion protein [Gammaproteobacteria bacterium]|nr:HlyD family secretion protein [Gammaproteobacteria bacterium]
MNKPLYRAEALAHQQDRLQGDVLQSRRPTLKIFVGCAVAFACVLIIFITFGHYTRKEHVVGFLAPTRGLIKIYTPQQGTVLSKRVVEGQTVRRGDILVTISSERSTSATRDVQASMLADMRDRRESLRRELKKQSEIDLLTAEGIAQRIASVRAEIAQAEVQLALQTTRVNSAEQTLARNERLFQDRYVSESTVQQRRDEMIDQRNSLAQLQRSITALTRELNAAQIDLAASSLRRSNNASLISRQISEIEQQLTELDTRRNVLLIAPADGVVTTILTEVGQAVAPGVSLMSILPAGASLEAQLLVPTRAAGFLKAQQQVGLRFQAFPYQRFGHHIGEVTEIGRSVLLPNEANVPLSVQEPVYRVTVRLPSQQVQAYGQSMSLQAGMLVDADIHIDRRRLLEWIFDPLLSVTGRV